ncbi:hypothetical protein KCP73_14630 [Salmonella enterica subsp. enterica]|nr:hypothetical protein KCP73_14630 [Salmonella enterica subsp. enterica]
MLSRGLITAGFEGELWVASRWLLSLATVCAWKTEQFSVKQYDARVDWR